MNCPVTTVDERAEDVRAILSLLRKETGSTDLSLSDTMMWTPVPATVHDTASERLQIGEWDDRAVYAYMKQPKLPYMQNMLSDLVFLACGDETETMVLSTTYSQIKTLEPFKHIDLNLLRPLGKDCPVNAFILSCFILRGHTENTSLSGCVSDLEGLRKALMDIEKGKTKGEKGKSLDNNRRTSQASAASSSNRHKVPEGTQPSLQKGNPTEGIAAALQKCFGQRSLPYLKNLKWEKNKDEGAMEKLRIGSRWNEAVFAIFNSKARFHQQIRIVQGHESRASDAISKADLSSVSLREPFSLLDIGDGSKRLAQKFRTYLKGCFALRGHAAGEIVSVDIASFVKSVTTIRATGYGGPPTKGSTSSVGARSVATTGAWIDAQIVHSPTAKSGASTTRSDTSALTDNFPRADIREYSAEITAPIAAKGSSRVARDRTLEHDIARHNESWNIRSFAVPKPEWNAVNREVARSQYRRFVMFSESKMPSKVTDSQGFSSRSFNNTDDARRLALEPQCTPTGVKATRASTPKQSLSRSQGSASSPGPFIAVAQSTSAVVEDFGSDSDIDSVQGHVANTSFNSNNNQTPDGALSVEYGIPECNEKSVDAWFDTSDAIATSSRTREEHLTTFRACELSIAELQAQLQAVTENAKFEETDIRTAGKAAIQSILSDPAQDPTTYFDSIQSASLDAKSKLAATTTALNDKRADLEAQIEVAAKNKTDTEAKIQEVDIELGNAKKRKFEMQSLPGFALGCAVTRELEKRDRKRVKT